MASKGPAGRSPMKKPTSAPSGKPPATWPEFRTWFWTKQNGNYLIKYLNDAGGTDNIRRESFENRPVIYCIVLKGIEFPASTDKVQWKMCKIGFTHCKTQERTNNRMEQVMNQIKKKYASRVVKELKPDPEPSVIFKLAIGPVDTTPYFQTEKRIRQTMGWPIKKELVKEMGLPCPTEWILTTQAFINVVKKKIKEAKGIDLFKKTKFKKHNPLITWAKVETDANGQVTCVAGF